MTTKAERIIVAVRENPSLTAKELATTHGCSKQHVWAVLAKEGLSASAPPPKVWSENPRTVQARAVTRDGSFSVNTCTSGSIGELMAATDLMARGWKVFFPLFRAHSDLIIQSADGTIVKRIEVRCAKRTAKGPKYNSKPADQCDHYALVIEGEPILYRPPI